MSKFMLVNEKTLAETEAIFYLHIKNLSVSYNFTI